MLNQDTLDAFAAMLAYPAARDVNEIGAACRHVEGAGAAPRGGARGLRLSLEDSGADRAQEHFTQVFDVNAARSLETGWHLYGEDYARGAFLVQMRMMLRELGVEEGSELPDYLPTLLRGLARLPEGKAAIFSTSYVQPALTRMLAGFAELETPYKAIVEDLLSALEAQFGETRKAEPPAQAVPYDASPACPPTCSP